jgi:hypothetical protein
MPITLGCPSCGKRFRAREESSGKKVKCPFCQAAVPVPTSEESQAAGAPTEVVPAPSGHAPMGTLNYASPPPPPTGPVPAASPDAWGAAAPAHAGEPIPFLAPPPPAIARPSRPTLPPMTAGSAPRKKTAEEQNAAAWKKCRSGLGTVLVGLFWLALLGFVPLGKFVYERSVGPLPAGESAEWFKIDGVLNTPGENAIQLDKSEVVNLLAYGVPILLGGLALTFGRVTAGAAPKSSGAKGLFAFSGLATLVALTGYLTHIVCQRVGFSEVSMYGLWAARLGGVLGEFWFLLALGAAGATLKRPASVRTVGFFSLLVGLGVALYFFGWDLLLTKVGPEIGRPRRPEAGSDWLLYEAAALLLGWLILIGWYWRSVGGVRRAISDYANE